MKASHSIPPGATYAVIHKDVDRRLVFGWASVAIDAAGEEVVDLQKDVLSEAELEDAAYLFNLSFRGTGEMHQGNVLGQCIESFFMNDEKLAGMGLVRKEGAPSVAWWVGFFIEDEATFAKVKDGRLRMFSIQGSGKRVPVEDAA